LVWAGEDATDEKHGIFLLAGGKSQAVLEEEWRQVGHKGSALCIPVSSTLQLRWWETPRATVHLVLCDLST